MRPRGMHRSRFRKLATLTTQLELAWLSPIVQQAMAFDRKLEAMEKRAFGLSPAGTRRFGLIDDRDSQSNPLTADNHFPNAQNRF